MKSLDSLLSIANRLLGPGGCPWDREQTIFSLQPFLLEETHELIEAIDLQEPKKILEELGDVLYTLIFISKRLEEMAAGFNLEQSIEKVSEKLIRRHPHIFGEKKVSSIEEVISTWDEVKKQEGKKSPISDIPPGLPSLARAQKVIAKMQKHKKKLLKEKISDDIGQKLWDLVKKAQKEGTDAEGALRRVCLAYEQKFEG